MTAKLQIPASAWSDPNQHRVMKQIEDALSTTSTAIAGLTDANGALVLVAVEQTFEDQYILRYGEDNTYPYIELAAAARTYTKFTVKCSTGSMTITPQINGVTLGGGASSVTTTVSSVTHTSNNVLPVGGRMELIGSGTSSAENVVIEMTYTINLATQ